MSDLSQTSCACALIVWLVLMWFWSKLNKDKGLGRKVLTHDSKSKNEMLKKQDLTFFRYLFNYCVNDVKIRLVINCMMMLLCYALWSVGWTCTSNDKIKEKERHTKKEDIFQPAEEIHTKNSHLVNFCLLQGTSINDMSFLSAIFYNSY